MKTYTCDEIDSMLEDYLSDTLTKEERYDVESHLTSCPHCYKALAHVKELNALLIARPLPSPILPRIEKEIRMLHAERRRNRRHRLLKPFVACFLLLLLLPIGLFGILQSLDRENSGSMNGPMDDFYGSVTAPSSSFSSSAETEEEKPTGHDLFFSNFDASGFLVMEKNEETKGDGEDGQTGAASQPDLFPPADNEPSVSLEPPSSTTPPGGSNDSVTEALSETAPEPDATPQETAPEQDDTDEEVTAYHHDMFYGYLVSSEPPTADAVLIIELSGKTLFVFSVESSVPVADCTVLNTEGRYILYILFL